MQQSNQSSFCNRLRIVLSHCTTMVARSPGPPKEERHHARAGKDVLLNVLIYTKILLQTYTKVVMQARNRHVWVNIAHFSRAHSTQCFRCITILFRMKHDLSISISNTVACPCYRLKFFTTSGFGFMVQLCLWAVWFSIGILRQIWTVLGSRINRFWGRKGSPGSLCRHLALALWRKDSLHSTL